MARCGLLASLVFLLVRPVPAFAADAAAAPDAKNNSEFSIGLGAGVEVTPYKEYDAQWFPVPILSYEGEYVYLRGAAAGIKIVNAEFLEVSAFVGYDDTRFESGDSSDARLRSLSDRHAGAVAGVEARLLTPYGMLHASLAQDVLDTSGSRSGVIGYMNSLEFGDLELVPAVGAQWNGRGYNNYYYGISGRESRNSGLESYDAGSGVSPYVGLTVGYSLDDVWEVFANGRLLFLSSAVRNSPMVDKDATYSLMLGFSCTF